MPESFDPYRVWLSIPPGSRPPTHYQLLGISPDEHDPTVINAAVMRQSAYVRNFQIGKYAEEAARAALALKAISARRASCAWAPMTPHATISCRQRPYTPGTSGSSENSRSIIRALPQNLWVAFAPGRSATVRFLRDGRANK